MTLEFRCADAGLACGDAVRGESEEELLERLAAHARDEHGVELNRTLIDYARGQVRRV